MDKNNFFKQDALRPTQEQRLLTRPFYANANEIYRRFNDWKDNDRFYFIPLYMEMTYTINGIVAELAPDPVWLGSFIQTTINHPDLFQFPCPKCGSTVLPSLPLCRFSAEWKGIASVSGWFRRGEALRAQIAADKGRYLKYKLLHPKAEPSSIEELLAD